MQQFVCLAALCLTLLSLAFPWITIDFGFYKSELYLNPLKIRLELKSYSATFATISAVSYLASLPSTLGSIFYGKRFILLSLIFLILTYFTWMGVVISLGYPLFKFGSGVYLILISALLMLAIY